MTYRSNEQRRRWAWWFIPRPFDVVSSFLYPSVLGMYFYNLLSDCGCKMVMRGGQAIVLIVVATLLLLCIDRVEYWRYGEETPRKVAIALLIARAVLIETVAQIDHFSFSPFLYLILPLLACLYFGMRTGYALAVLAWLIYMLKHVLRHSFNFNTANGMEYLFVFTIALVFVLMMARAVLTERASRAQAERLLAALESSHQQLKLYSEQAADLAATRERNRLARDIHDTLGHYLTVINVQLEKAQAFRKKKPEEADRAVSDARRMASEALQDVRRSVGALRQTEELFAFWPSMNALIDQFRSEQYQLILRVEGHEEGFSKQRLLTLYRVVQEGLTNIRKHAQAHNVQLDLCFGEQEAVLSLHDDGRGFDPSMQHNGYGLQGIQERLEIIGGMLTIESESGTGSAPGKGTRLNVRVPKDSYIPNPVSV
jgi:signal transduction histidine kinase